MHGISNKRKLLRDGNSTIKNVQVTSLYIRELCDLYYVRYMTFDDYKYDSLLEYVMSFIFSPHRVILIKKNFLNKKSLKRTINDYKRVVGMNTHKPFNTSMKFVFFFSYLSRDFFLSLVLNFSFSSWVVGP